MGKSEYILPAPETVAMTPSAADRLISSGNGSAALLYIYILRCGGYYSGDAARESLGYDFPAEEAMKALSDMGLVSPEAAKTSGERKKEKQPAPAAVVERADVPPEYSAAEIKRGMDDNADFARLLREVQQRLGRVMSSGDLVILYGIYDYLGLPAQVILMLISYCIEEQERRFGEGRRPTLRMIEKEAYFWARSELYTIDAAEQYIKTKNERRRSSSRIKNMLGIKNRTLSATEEKYIMSWLDMGFTADAIAVAYDRTVLNKGALVWPYMNRIMESWHKKGLHDTQEILAGDRKGTGAPSGSGSQKAGTPTDEEYERMRRYVNKLGGGSDGT